jgi:hypothetical protein
MTRLAHFFQMTVSSSLLGSERADDCQFLETDQSFCYIFFWCVTFCYNDQNCNDRVSIVNKPHQLLSPYGGGEHSEPGGTPSPTQTHVGAPLHQTAFAIQVAVIRLGTLSDWLGQGEGSSRNQAFRLPPKSFYLSTGTRQVCNFRVCDPVEQS